MLKVNLGQAGETVADKFLTAQGFTVKERNYHCPLGEVDMVALKKDVLYFMEVKTRASTNYGWPAEAVTKTKQEKLRKLAQYYLLAHPHSGPITFGVIEVLYDRWQHRYQVNFIADAF